MSKARSLKVDDPAAGAHTLLALEGIEKTFHLGNTEVKALRSVSLHVDHGELLAIMGASGSGKSTMLNIIGTLDRPDAGSYFLDGIATHSLDEAALAAVRNKKLGFVFQAFNLLPRDTALANVELPMVYAGIAPSERRRRALAALARVGLSDRAHHLPNQLSGGQQQRVSIARAIVNEPVLLLADEPTGALDSETSRSVMALFLELHQQGMTVIIVTHDAGIAAYAERVVRFLDGRIVSDEKQAPQPVPVAQPIAATASMSAP